MRFLFLALLVFPLVSASPLIQEGYLSLHDIVYRDGNVSGEVGLHSAEGIENATLVLTLVRGNAPRRYASIQEWAVGEWTLEGVVERASFSIPVPSFAPEGEYRLEVYVLHGRRYLGSYYPAMSTPAFARLSLPGPGSDVPVIDLVRTSAGNLTGTLGPFVDAGHVNLTIALVDDGWVDARIDGCRWDDRGDACAELLAQGESPLMVRFPLPANGSYGIRVEVREGGEVTSISKLRAVRNGTSPRVLDIAYEDGYHVVVLPSQDNRADMDVEVEFLPGSVRIPVDFPPGALGDDRSVIVAVPLCSPRLDEVGSRLWVGRQLYDSYRE